MSWKMISFHTRWVDNEIVMQMMDNKKRNNCHSWLPRRLKLLVLDLGGCTKRLNCTWQAAWPTPLAACSSYLISSLRVRRQYRADRIPLPITRARCPWTQREVEAGRSSHLRCFRRSSPSHLHLGPWPCFRPNCNSTFVGKAPALATTSPIISSSRHLQVKVREKSQQCHPWICTFPSRIILATKQGTEADRLLTILSRNWLWKLTLFMYDLGVVIKCCVVYAAMDTGRFGG